VQTLQTDYLMLAALPSAAGSARRYARRMLTDWGFDTMINSVEIVVSELVTNAVKATGISEERPSWGLLYDRANLICLCVSATSEASVIIEVWDRERRPPRVVEAGADDEHGRGLKLVSALSIRWGTRWPSAGGKIVWCECAEPVPAGRASAEGNGTS
jgi:anti-sigma regulatory factor (Ser/Thr protein kinase)